MENIDYKLALMEVISLIKDKATYLKTIDANSDAYNPEYYEGMAMSYYFVLDGIKSYIESNDNMRLEDFGLENYYPEEIMEYKPLNLNEEKK